jgi:hypothetical protein
MSDTDRRFDRQGAEPPLTFDTRRRPRARGPAPVTLIVSVLVLALVAGAVAYMYRSGPRQATVAAQPPAPASRDVRAPATPATRSPGPGDGLTISKDEPAAPARSAAAAPTFAPPPEPPLAAPVATAPSPPPPSPPPTQAAVARAAPRPPRAERPDAIGRLIARADHGPSPPVRAVPRRPGAGDAAGPVVVQIGAFSSQQLADTAWSNAAAVAPGEMAGKGKRVVAIDRDGAALYRTAITGFESRDEAVALCERLRAAGGSCFVR